MDKNGGVYTKLGSWDFNVSIGVSVSKWGIGPSAGFTYTFSKDGVTSPPVDLKYIAQTNGYTDPVHKFGLTRKDLILTSEGNHFVATAQVKGGTSGSSKSLDTYWDFVISAKYIFHSLVLA